MFFNSTRRESLRVMTICELGKLGWKMTEKDPRPSFKGWWSNLDKKKSGDNKNPNQIIKSVFKRKIILIIFCLTFNVCPSQSFKTKMGSIVFWGGNYFRVSSSFGEVVNNIPCGFRIYVYFSIDNKISVVRIWLLIKY